MKLIFLLRQSMSTAIALTIVTFFYWHSYTQSYFSLVMALLVSQTTSGTKLKQGFNFLLLALVSLFISSLIFRYSPSDLLADSVVSVLLITAGLTVASQRPLTYQRFLIILTAPLLFLLVRFNGGIASAELPWRLLDAFLGGAIAIAVNQILSVTALSKQFRCDLIVVLESLIAYSETLMMVIADEKFDKLIAKKNQLQNILRPQTSCYPEWVYEVGFNPALRAGFRYFLIELEMIIDLYLAMNTQTFAELKQTDLAERVTAALFVNQTLMQTLLTYCQSRKWQQTNANFVDDVTELESAVRKKVPTSLELLDLSHDYVALANLVRDIKDARQYLLQLVMSLN